MFPDNLFNGFAGLVWYDNEQSSASPNSWFRRDVEFKEADDDGCMPGTCPSSEPSFVSFLLGGVRLVDKHNDVGVNTTTAKDFCALEFHHEEEDRMADPEARVGQTVLPNSSVRPQLLE